MLNLEKVTSENKTLAKKLQALIFPHEKYPSQVDDGIKTDNPSNYIAFSGGSAVGIVGYYKNPDLPQHLLINWFGILPEFRKHGYGREIVEWLIDLGKSRAEEYLTTYTEKGDNDDAIALYKKMDFMVEDYCNKADIENLRERGVENNYVICSFRLKENVTALNFEEINLHIAEDIDAIRHTKQN